MLGVHYFHPRRSEHCIKTNDNTQLTPRVVIMEEDDYDPKKHKDVPLTRGEKFIIFLGSLAFVLILVLIRHPEIYSKVEPVESLEFLESPNVFLLDGILSAQNNSISPAILVEGFATSDGTADFSRRHLSPIGTAYQISTSGQRCWLMNLSSISHI